LRHFPNPTQGTANGSHFPDTAPGDYVFTIASPEGVLLGKVWDNSHFPDTARVAFLQWCPVGKILETARHTSQIQRDVPYSILGIWVTCSMVASTTCLTQLPPFDRCVGNRDENAIGLRWNAGFRRRAPALELTLQRSLRIPRQGRSGTSTKAQGPPYGSTKAEALSGTRIARDGCRLELPGDRTGSGSPRTAGAARTAPVLTKPINRRGGEHRIREPRHTDSMKAISRA